MLAENELHVDRRRAELGDFLRRRRAELTPGMTGLPATNRRRTPGLRREEVAELANISTALYAWLEQGRDVPVSRKTVDAIAQALRCTPSEREHMYALATHESGELHEHVSPTLERFVASLRTHPIFVVDHKWDIVLLNRAAQVVFSHEMDVPRNTNLLEATFDDLRKRLFPNWRDVAVNIVELFRYDYALYASEPGPLALVERLRSSDPDFAAIWEEHRVRRTPNSMREIDHPVAGTLCVEPSMYTVLESPGLRYMVYTPKNDETANKIEGLVADSFAGSSGAKRPAAVAAG